jgi:hypothetical protein
VDKIKENKNKRNQGECTGESTSNSLSEKQMGFECEESKKGCALTQTVTVTALHARTNG